MKDYTKLIQHDYIKPSKVCEKSHFEETKNNWINIKKDVLDSQMYIRYNVKKNDSLMRISFLSGISEKQIKKQNNLSSSSLVEG